MLATILGFMLTLEFGLVTENAWYLYQQDTYSEQLGEMWYSDVNFEVTAWDTIFVGSEVTTYMHPLKINSWDPSWITYTFSTGLRFDPLEIGFRHLCTHPIQTYVRSTSEYKEPLIEGGYEEIYLSLTFKGGKS